MLSRLLLLAHTALLALTAVAADPAPPLPKGAVARLGGVRLRHADDPSCLAFAPDGKRLVTGGCDGAVRLWDVATGEQVAVHSKPSRTVASIQFTHGGTRVAVNFLDGYIRFLDPATLRETAAMFAPTVGRFVVSPDSAMTVTRGPNGEVRVDEIATGLPKLEFPVAELAAFRPDSKAVAVGFADGAVTVALVTGGKPVWKVHHGGKLTGLAFRPDGKALATAGAGPPPRVKVWMPGAEEPAVVLDADGPVAFIGEERIAVQRAGGIGVYDLPTRAWVRTVPMTGPFAVSADGSKLAAAAAGSVRVRLWDVATGEELHTAVAPYPNPALVVPWADGKGLFLIADNRAFVWRVGEPTSTPACEFGRPVHKAAAGGRRLAVVTGRDLLLWDDFDPTRPLGKPAVSAVVGGPAAVTAVAVSPDGNRLAVSTADREIKLLDPATGEPLRTVGPQTAAESLAFTPDGGKLLVLGRDGFVRLWTLGENGPGEEGWQFRVPRSPGGGVAVSRDGRLVAAASAYRVVVLDAATGKTVSGIGERDADGIVRSLAFTPDGGRLVVGVPGVSGGVRVWDVPTGRPLAWFSTGLGGVTHVALFPDGRRAASTGTDEAVTVWDLGANGVGK